MKKGEKDSIASLENSLESLSSSKEEENLSC